MRVSSDTKEETRRRILDAAHRLFARNGFAETTTRDIAGAAKIAAGTLFNYFPTKEALAASLVADALESAREETRTSPVAGETLEEDLFALMASTLRHLTPHRRYLSAALEVTLRPATFEAAEASEAGRARHEHLQTVRRLIGERGRAASLSAPTLHLYWTLYLGVLSFWASDRSPGQEQTRALVDRSVRAFAACLEPNTKESPNDLIA